MITKIKNLFRKRTIADEWSGFKAETNEDMVEWQKIEFSMTQLQKAYMKKVNHSYNINKLYHKTNDWDYFLESQKIRDRADKIELDYNRIRDLWDKKYKEINFKYGLMMCSVASS